MHNEFSSNQVLHVFYFLAVLQRLLLLYSLQRYSLQFLEIFVYYFILTSFRNAFITGRRWQMINDNQSSSLDEYQALADADKLRYLREREATKK